MPAFLPAVGQVGAAFRTNTLPFFTYLLAKEGSTHRVTPEVVTEELLGRNDEVVADDTTRISYTVTGTYRHAAAGGAIYLNGYVLAKADPDDIDNDFEGDWLKIEALTVGPMIANKPIEYTMTLRWRPEFQTIGDASGLADLDVVAV